MGRRSRDDRSGHPMGPPPGIAALRAWRQAERQRRAERVLREKERARRQAATEKRRARVEQEAALRVEQAERTLAHTREALDRDEQAVLARIGEINARRLVTVKSVASLVFLVVLLVTPHQVVAYFKVHKLPAEQALVLASGVLISYALAVIGSLLWCECILAPVLTRSSSLTAAEQELDGIVRKRNRLSEGRYRLHKPARLYQRWEDTPFVIRFD